MSVINTNVNAIIAQNAGVKNERLQTTAMQRLSTGSRINSASDDAAGLAISTKMTSQIRGLNQAVRNANDGISLIQTAEGALTEVNNMLQRMRELAVQSASDTNTTSDRTALDAEFGALRDEINRIGNNTQFNGMNVLDQSFVGNGTGTTDVGRFVFQVGANASQTIDIQLGDFRTTGGVATSTITDSGTDYTWTSAASASSSVATGAEASFLIDNVVYTATASGIGSTATTSPASAVAAFLADETFVNALGLAGISVTDNEDGTMTFASSDGSTLAIQETTSQGSLAQQSTLTFDASDTFATDDVLTFTIGGVTATYTVATGDVTADDGWATLASSVITNIGTTITDSDLIDTFTASSNALVITGAADISFTYDSAVNNTSGGDLYMINTSTITTQDASNTAIENVDLAIAVVSGERATMGATINRLNYAADNLTATSANVSASRSRVQDTDYSAETTELARTQIIQQASTAMLAQANQSAQSVLSLLK